LEASLNLETNIGPVLSYAPYYFFQMMLAGGFTLLKLCKSFFSVHIDLDYTKNLFNRTIWAIRAVSVSSNDLPERLAEVLAQLWKLGGTPTPQPATSTVVDDSLQLKVRCRMSMSLVYDSVWRWREDALAKGRNIEGTLVRIHLLESSSDHPCPAASLKIPTDPDSNGDSSASSLAALRTSSSTPGVMGDPSLAPAPPLPQGLGISASNNDVNSLPSAVNGVMEPNYEVFDPLNWLLDGLVDFPYTYPTMQGMETQGMA
jgi:hypothetical protein